MEKMFSILHLLKAEDCDERMSHLSAEVVVEVRLDDVSWGSLNDDWGRGIFKEVGVGSHGRDEDRKSLRVECVIGVLDLEIIKDEF